MNRVSVIIVALLECAQMERCLTALLHEAEHKPAEVIVPVDEGRQPLLTLRGKFPAVNFLPCRGQLTYAQLRSQGILASTGDIVAITEDHCIPRPDWLKQIVAAHESGPAAIGGAVEKLTPDSSLNWALYLADYLRYMTPMPAGPTQHLTDCNVTYKRSALERIRPVWAAEFHEPEVHQALQEQGDTLWFSPDIVVAQQRPMALKGALTDRYAFGRLFGGRRALAASSGERFKYIILGPLLPALLTLRVLLQLLRKRRHFGAFLRALPNLILLNTTWAWGEFVGYVTGETGSEQLTKTA